MIKQYYELYVEYEPITGTPTPDGLVAKVVDEAVDHVTNPNSGSDYMIVTSSELVITEVRVRVKQGQLDTALTSIYYEGEEVVMHSNGRFANWPKGFCDTWDNQLDKLLDL